MKKILFSAIVSSAVIISSAALAEPGKCSPCQAAKSIREALAQSIKDAQKASLEEGGAFSREQELDADRGCGCQRTTRDEIAADVDADRGCACKTMRDQTMSLVEIANAALVAAQILMESQLDAIPFDVSRAPREELTDPCNPCEPVVCDTACESNIDAQLKALRCCCAALTSRLACQGAAAKKCCKKIKHKIEDVEELVETVIDQSADCCSLTESLLVSVIDQNAVCCSVTDTRLGDLGGSALDIPFCQFGSITDVVNAIDDADIITWLKSIYVLLYNVHLCTCCNF